MSLVEVRGDSLLVLLDVSELSHLQVRYSQIEARLYRGDGQGGFEDVAVERGLENPTAPMGSNFGDLDNDGYLDIYLGTGYPDYQDVMPNVMYRNRTGERP